jgi:glycosyltransferase involved in cell wall biosynthesis
VDLPGQLLALGQGAQVAPEVLIHDFFPLSPSYTLLDSVGRYHGPLDLARDGADRAHTTRRPDGTPVSLAQWQAAWGALIAQAGQITVFSADSRDQVLAVYPDAGPRIALRPHDLPQAVPPVPRPAGPRRVVGVLGNIGPQKGLGVLADLGARWTGPADPGLVVIGNTDPALPLPAHVRVHGDYRVTDIPALVARYGITDWLIPSIWPETFSFTTHEALATGLPVMAFAIGAQGAAVAAAANGLAVPFGPTGNLARNVINAMTGGSSGAAERQDQ